MYTGYTKELDRDTQLTNLINACNEHLSGQPSNQYWQNILLQAEVEQEQRRVKWLGGYELPESPSVEWLETKYLNDKNLDEYRAKRKAETAVAVKAMREGTFKLPRYSDFPRTGAAPLPADDIYWQWTDDEG